MTERKPIFDGGIVGGDKSKLTTLSENEEILKVEEVDSKLTQLANKLFNAKPNEEIINALKGEIQVPPDKIPNVAENIKKFIDQLYKENKKEDN